MKEKNMNYNAQHRDQPGWVTFSIETRLAGTRQQYHVGRVLNSQGEVVAVHTSKDRNYLVKTLQNKC